LSLKPAEIFTQLQNRDFRMLEAIELGMRNHALVPMDLIGELSGFSRSLVVKLLRELHQKKLIVKGRPAEYVLLKGGYDVLALRALVKQDILDGIGEPIGVGKESDVYEGIALGDHRVALKFHRLGRPSFQHTRRLRSYIGQRRHISDLYEARLAAKREHEALVTLAKVGIRVPEPIGYNRHIIVMDYLDGELLQRIRELPAPIEIYKDLMEDYTRSVRACGIIHGDFSEYNVIIREDLTPWIIDWPQQVATTHPNAETLLMRDVNQVQTFFTKLTERLFGPESPPVGQVAHIAEECRNTILESL
jgi:RIO kinase 2